MDREWKQNTIDARNPEKFYYDIRNEKIYEQFVEKRNAQRIWHQASLGVIPTNSFLKKINCGDSDKCKYDGEIETNNHFIKHCTAYENVWDKKYPKRNSKNTDNEDLEVLLDEDKPPPFKKKIAKCLLKSYVERNRK